MIKRTAAALLLLGTSGLAQAHEVWVERDGAGPARIYLGEPEGALPEGGDPEFHQLKAPKLVPASTAPMTRKAGFIEVVVPAGDVRVIDDAVFAPWGPEGKKEGVVYYARAGRSDARPALALEIAPVTANGDRFVLTHDGKPVVDGKITVITPERWTKSLTTDAQGIVTVPLREKGRYLLTTSQKQEGQFDTPGGNVTVLHQIATTTFMRD